MKKTMSLLLGGLVLVLSFSGCAGGAAENEDKNEKGAHISETVYGQVQSVEGSSAVLLLGTLSQAQPPSDMAAPENRSGGAETAEEAEPSGSDGETGAADSEVRPPEVRQEGGAPQNGAPDGGLGPEAGSGGEAPEGFAGGGEMPQPSAIYSFDAGEETLTVDVGGLDVKIGDILEVVFDENGKAGSVSLRSDVFAPGSMGAPGNGAGERAE